MNKIMLYSISLFMFSPIAEAAILTSSFTITNKQIESESFKSTEPAMNYTNNGSGFYTITDTHTDANIHNLPGNGLFTWSYGRRNSITQIIMKGKRLGHTFIVNGKIGPSSVIVQQKTGGILIDGLNISYYPGAVGTCDNVTPIGLPVQFNHQGTEPINISISVNKNMQEDAGGCTSTFLFYTKLLANPITTTGISREFYLDLASIQNDIKYRNAPPDIYEGSSVSNGIIFLGFNSFIVPINYTNNVTIIKKPYFDNVTLSSSENLFTVKTVNSELNGSVTVPYVMNGQFTAFDRITLNVTSQNNFSLVNAIDANKRIPYSLSTTIGTRKFQLVNNGIGTGPVIFTDLPKSASAIQGRYDANFSLNKNSVISGDYTDTLTAVYQIDLL